MKKNIHFFIATFFGVGKIPYMPGTIGSLLAIPLYFFFIFLTAAINGGIRSAASFSTVSYMLFILSILFIIGMFSSASYEKACNKSDPSEIIIDEIVGQLFAIILIVATIPFDSSYILLLEKLGISHENYIYVTFLASFILFRIFDIFKPWPINYIEKNVKGGLGVMLDDLIAGFMSFVSFYLIIFFIYDLIK